MYSILIRKTSSITTAAVKESVFQKILITSILAITGLLSLGFLFQASIPLFPHIVINDDSVPVLPIGIFGYILIFQSSISPGISFALAVIFGVICAQAPKLLSMTIGKSSPETRNGNPPSAVDIQMQFDLTREPKPNLGLPPNAIPGLFIIKSLIRGLRYRSVDSLIGLKVTLSSIERAPEELCSLIRQHGTDLSEDVQELSAGAFLKYGLLDYDFVVLASELPAERQRAKFLKNVGLLLDKKDVDDSIFPDGGIGFLEEMFDEVRKNKLIFKILLDSQGKYTGAQGMPAEKWMNADPNKYFPCEFIVRDACLTNCSQIWLDKHFYL